MEIERVYRSPLALRGMIVGIVGRDPEVKYLPNRQAVASFSVTKHIDSWGVATTSGVLERREVNADVSHEVTVIGWLAEVCGKYLAKGQEVHIEGRMHTRRNADGERQRVVVADGIYFVGAPRKTGLGQDVASASCLTAAASKPRSKHAWRSSSLSKDGITRIAVTRHSTTSHQSITNEPTAPNSTFRAATNSRLKTPRRRRPRRREK